MRLFAQLSWYFRREWRRYLGAVALLVIIAMLQLVPPKVVGIVVDGVTEQHFTTGQILMWIATMVLIAVVVYLLRYVWRVLLFGASYQLAVELREDYYRQLAGSILSFTCVIASGDLMARATNDVDRVVFAAGEGADAGGFTGNGLRCVDYDVYANWLAVDLICPVADASDGDHDQAQRRCLA